MIRTLTARLSGVCSAAASRINNTLAVVVAVEPSSHHHHQAQLQQVRSLHSSLPVHTTWRELDMNTSDRKRLRDKLANADVAEARTVESLAAPVVADSPNSTLRTFWFPDEHTNSLMIDGVKYDELPIVHLKATKNNTIVTLTDHKGLIICQRSGGTEGFVNAKKGTNIAGQAAGSAMAFRAIDKGIKYVRVVVRGIGPGRFSSIKGLQLSGLTVVSVTDRTPNLMNPNARRPRKARRV